MRIVIRLTSQFIQDTIKMVNIIEQSPSSFSNTSAKRIARQLVDVRDDKRKSVLKSMTSEMKCRVVEEMVNIRLERLRDSKGNISPAKVSER